MSIPSLFLLLVAALPGPIDVAPATTDRSASESELAMQRDALRTIWRECLFDRADALAGYARVRPDKAAELAFAGCEEKARFFRELVRETSPEPERQSTIAAADEEMRQFASLVARTSAAVPP